MSDRAATLTREILSQLFGPPDQWNFAVRFWNGATLPAGNGPAPFTLVFQHPGTLRRMFRPPLELALGEAFICGDFDIEGSVHSAVTQMDALRQNAFSASDLFALARRLIVLPKGTGPRYHGRGPARLAGSRHSRQRDRAAIHYHYDVGNDFYALWLDRNMTYSCAYFPTGTESLDSAQEQKYELICKKLRLQPGERLLDIGCGWGGLVMYAARHYGVTALGVTLSEQQVAYAAERIAASGLQDQAQVELRDYRDLRDASFDKVVSVGMFEHVGENHLPEYFGQVYRLLKPGGLFLNHGISRRPQKAPRGWAAFVERYILGAGTFIQRYIFPDGELVPVSAVNLAAEWAGFEVRDVENLREHYALTLRHWVARLEAHHDEAVRVASEATYRTWRLYMAASARGFDTGQINVNQTLLAKLADGRSGLPWSRADLRT
ncbi:MAG: class I SAM-dependent methyltransferase [Chloroflexi bacterium]|nr:class I SAM-dependent methyltransferase [Chloroflexota bacterium]